MNKNEKFFLLQKITSLLTYSELLPDEFQSNYIADIDSVKKLIADYKIVDDKVNTPSALNINKLDQNKPLKEVFGLGNKITSDNKITPDDDDDETHFDNSKPALIPSLGSSFRQKNMVEEELYNQEEGNNSDLEQLQGKILPSPTPNKPELKIPQKGGGTMAPPPKPMMVGMHVPPPPVNTKNTTAFVNYMKSTPTPPTPPNQPSNQNNDKNQSLPKQEKKSSFEFVNSLLVPKVTDEGKAIMGSLSFPINLYLVLKLVDGKTSLFKLFEKYYKLHSVNYVDFANNLYELEQQKYISFVRTIDATSRDAGLIKVEELFSDGKVVSEANLAKAQDTMKATGGLFISKTLMSMNIINESYLGQCMKIQKWASRIFEKSPYARPESEVKASVAQETKTPSQPNLQQQLRTTLITQNNLAPQAPIIEKIEVEKDDLGLMDFIIPVFNEKGKEILTNPAFAELAKIINIIKESESLFQNYLYNKDTFNSSRLGFLKFISKLDSQDIFDYKENENLENKPIWGRLGELLVSLKLVTEDQLKEALDYKDEHNTYIGEAFSTLGFIEESVVDDCLKVQTWMNRVLSSISHETAFVEVMKNVLMESFRCKVDIGSLQKVAFTEPLKNIVYIHYPISGKLSGTVYYISDKSFMNNLARTMMNSLGTEATELDESYVGTVSSVIISNSLSKLSQKGLFNPSEMAKILMEKEVKMEPETIVAGGNKVDMIPLINQWGRFAICLETKSN